MSFDFIKARVLIPAGKCPANLTSESLEDITSWIEEVDKFKKPDEIYEASVYRYWVRKVFLGQPELLEIALENISIATGSRETLYSLMKESCQ